MGSVYFESHLYEAFGFTLPLERGPALGPPLFERLERIGRIQLETGPLLHETRGLFTGDPGGLVGGCDEVPDVRAPVVGTGFGAVAEYRGAVREEFSLGAGAWHVNS